MSYIVSLNAYEIKPIMYFIFRNRFKLSSLLAPLLNNQTEQKIVEAESDSNK